jgi:hypothetical protein
MFISKLVAYINPKKMFPLAWINQRLVEVVEKRKNDPLAVRTK